MDNWKIENYRHLLKNATDEEQINIIAEMLDDEGHETLLNEGVMDMLSSLGIGMIKQLKGKIKSLRRNNKLLEAIADDMGIPAETIERMSQKERVELKHKWMLKLQDDISDALF